MNWLITLLTIPLAPVVWTSITLMEKYRAAHFIGLPIIISPVSTLNLFWILTCRFCPFVLLLRYLPFGFGTWARCTYIGWQYNDKHALHDELGPIFTIVTPARNEVIFADPQAAHNILTRRKDFIKPAMIYDQLNIFGRNVNTVEGDDWQRQRRLTAPNFNEKTSAAVWGEALRQAESMGNAWIRQGAKGTRDVASNTATLALHVLTKVGFGESYDFHGGVRRLPAGHQMTYADALTICLGNIITFSIFSRSFLTEKWLPKGLQRVGLAAQEFQLHMEELLAREKARKGEERSLMSALVHAAEESQEDRPSEVKSRLLRLSDDEIYGNIFAFNLAGHETTANTIAAAIVLLAAYPQSTKLGSPKRSIMYETLRLYGSIVFIPKSTGPSPQPITSSSGPQYILPPNTAVTINVQALHTDVKTWGTDTLTWRPTRWFTLIPSHHPSANTSIDNAPPIDPAPGTFIPWADGQRVCLGKNSPK